MNHASRPDAAGFSLVELMISLVIFALAMGGLLSMAILGTDQLRAGASEDERWAVAHQKMEELIATDTAALAGGLDTVRGHPLEWTIVKGAPTRIILVVGPEEGALLRRADTIVTYVDNR